MLFEVEQTHNLRINDLTLDLIEMVGMSSMSMSCTLDIKMDI